ncbi:MAG: EVE domain-containing protein, partial [Pseudoalteromonas sp.]
MAYWLFKTEPDDFSINDLKNSPKQTTMWEGVRNYQARNFIRDNIKQGDLVMLYHSSCKHMGV